MSWMIYGANGYTGELAAREAIQKGPWPRFWVGATRRPWDGWPPSSVCRAGPSPSAMPKGRRRGLHGVEAVLHCAGPFIHTSAPMVNACLTAGAHYLDITGEIAVFESVLARGEEARKAGVALLPGVGFDVVPSDCLAARLAAALPDATELVLAFDTAGGGISRGTMKTMIESLPGAGAIRRNGEIVPVPVAFDVREIDFGPPAGKRWAMTIPWGDVSTAYHSTGIPNIRVYSGTPPSQIRRMKRLAPLLPLGGWGSNQASRPALGGQAGDRTVGAGQGDGPGPPLGRGPKRRRKDCDCDPGDARGIPLHRRLRRGKRRAAPPANRSSRSLDALAGLRSGLRDPDSGSRRGRAAENLT